MIIGVGVMNNPTFGTFRGSWTLQDEWVHGSLIKIGLTYYIRQDCELFPNNGKKIYYESLGMFTGIYDTNDKPIYGNIPLPDGTMSRGGDILSGDGYPYFNEGIQTLTVDDIKQNYVAIPSWNGDATYHAVGDVRGISHGLPINEELDELKIIGNEYENPELLEGES